MTTRRNRAPALAVLAATVALSTAACSGSVVHTYKSFSSAVERGASCSELFDQRSRFENPATLAKIDADLNRIGCTSPGAARTDR